MQINYKVKESSIPGAGLGVFADESVKKGDIVWKFEEKNHELYYSKKELEAKVSPMTYKDAQTYLKHSIDYDTNLVAHLKDDSKYINHSSINHNLGDCGDKYKDSDGLYACATRDINKNEEILENYLASYYRCKWMNQLFAKYNVWRPYPLNNDNKL